MARGSLSQLGRSRYSAGRREVRPQHLPSRADHALQHVLEGGPGPRVQSRTNNDDGQPAETDPAVLPQSSVGNRRVTCSCARVSPDFERRSSFVDAGWAEFWHRTGWCAAFSHRFASFLHRASPRPYRGRALNPFGSIKWKGQPSNRIDFTPKRQVSCEAWRIRRVSRDQSRRDRRRPRSQRTFRNVRGSLAQRATGPLSLRRTVR